MKYTFPFAACQKSPHSCEKRDQRSRIKDQGRYFPYLVIWKMKNQIGQGCLIQNRLSNGNLKDTFPDPCSLILDPSDKESVSVSDPVCFFDSLNRSSSPASPGSCCGFTPVFPCGSRGRRPEAPAFGGGSSSDPGCDGSPRSREAPRPAGPAPAFLLLFGGNGRSHGSAPFFAKGSPTDEFGLLSKSIPFWGPICGRSPALRRSATECPASEGSPEIPPRPGPRSRGPPHIPPAGR